MDYINTPHTVFRIEGGPWWTLVGLLYQYSIFKSSNWNALEAWAPVDFIYGGSIFIKWVAEGWLHERGLSYYCDLMLSHAS